MRIRLGGLADGELAEFIRLATGCRADDGADGDRPRAHRRERVPRHGALARARGRGRRVRRPDRARLVRPASELGTPATVREVANQRLQRLSPSTIELLELAAVVGADFELATIRARTCSTEAPSSTRSTRRCARGSSSSVRVAGSRTGSRTSSFGGRSSGASAPEPPSCTFVSRRPRGHGATAGRADAPRRSPTTSPPPLRSAMSNAPSR